MEKTNKKLKELIIGFENVEVIHVPGDDVGSYLVDRITQYIMNDFYSYDTFVGENAGLVNLILKPCADRKLEEPYNADTVFERIMKFRDITGLEFIFDDDTSRKISVPWEGLDPVEIENQKQSSAVTEGGCLIVCINTNQTAEEEAKVFRGTIPKET